jgi:hypothetical protein
MIFYQTLGKYMCVGAIIFALGCGSEDEAGGGQPTVQELFDPAIKTVEIEVDYVPGAEPYTGALGESEDLWALFRVNADRLFPDKEIICPSTLEEMERLDGEGGGSFTTERILDIAERHRDLENLADRATFYAVWVDGFFEDEDGVQNGVLGVSIGNTGVIAMFKPVLAGAEALPRVVRFGEQTTFIHEFAHAAGLVNRGIPLTSEHHDDEHGAHCSNTRCVMYWANARLLSLLDFVRNFIDSGDTIVFEDDCLDDIDAFSSAADPSNNP